jgi:hypothetical protein
MPIDYEEVKSYFYTKLGKDIFGMGRMESAFYHTAQWIFDTAQADLITKPIHIKDKLPPEGSEVWWWNDYEGYWILESYIHRNTFEYWLPKKALTIPGESNE